MSGARPVPWASTASSPTGHWRHGILLTPLSALAVAELLTSGEVPDVVAPFTPRRFAGSWRA